MAQVDTAYQRSLEEFGQKRFRQGRDEGIREGRDEGIREGRDEGIREGRGEGQAVMLGQLVRQKFGPETAQELSRLLGKGPDSGRLSLAARALLESTTAEELLARTRRL